MHSMRRKQKEKKEEVREKREGHFTVKLHERFLIFERFGFFFLLSLGWGVREFERERRGGERARVVCHC